MRLALLALLALGCATSRDKLGPFWVTGQVTEEERAQTLGIAAAAQRLYPDSLVRYGREIHLAPDIDSCCGLPNNEPAGVLHYAGCAFQKVCVLWPHAKLPLGADLTASALPHELGHLCVPYRGEDQADAAALLIVQEYRKGVQ